MPALALGNVSLREYPGGANVVTWDIDPSGYDPYAVAIRGQSTRVLDGTVVRQFLGLQKRDFTITLEGKIATLETFQLLWTKYRQGAGGVQFEFRDWFGSSFLVVFAPGETSFHPVPVPGSCAAYTYTMRLLICDILLWYGSAY